MNPQKKTTSKTRRLGHGGGPGRLRYVAKAKDSQKALRRLVSYLRPFIAPILFVLFLVILTTAAGLLGPYLMGIAIDDFIGNSNLDGLKRIALLMLFVYFLNTFLQTISNWIMASVSQTALKRLRGDLFDHIQTLSLRFFDKNPAGELMSRLTNDIEAINQAVSQNITGLFASALSLIGILIAMFILNTWLALASLLIAPLMFWFTSFLAKYTRRGFRVLQKDLGKLNGTIEEAISGARVVKVFHRDQSILETFDENSQAVYDAGLYANTYGLMLMPLTNQFGNLFVILLAGLGGLLALQGLVTIGTIATFISYGRGFINPVRQIANMFNSIQAALAGSERIFEILDTRAEVVDADNAVAIRSLLGDVQFDKVEFAYNEETEVIRNLSFEAKSGETIALVGPTGAGKTTLINLLSRFYDIDKGSITVDGMDLRQVKKTTLRRQLGIVLQDTYLFSSSVMDNIRYGRLDARDDEVIEAAKIADADHFIRQLPQGYLTILSERGSNLSQGQRQLLAIARAILADPSILILDEATSSVDTRTEARIQKSLLRLMENRTSFVIAHRLSTIRDADKVIVINEGQIIEHGTHDELLAAQGFYHNLYLSQFKGKEI